MPENINRYARFLKARGGNVINVDGVDWHEHSGFMIPAFLPHCCPKIPPQMAREVIRISGRPFAKWEKQFGEVEKSEWWWIAKKNGWTVEEVQNKKKRWMIRQGKKNFHVRVMQFDEVLDSCPGVAEAATARYKGNFKVETYEFLSKQVAAVRQTPGVCEYIGCFHEDKLVSFSENHIQNKGVWMANIRHDPEYLKKYSGYALIDGILEHYLNKMKMDYVFDGSRTIHHRTDVQDHLERVFGFEKVYAIINVIYSHWFKAALKMAYPFRKLFWSLEKVFPSGKFDNVGAVLRLEKIRRTCMEA
ncbi:MAG: hypothetical protein ACYSSP_07450 [Planctomycetota bacterium]|jgi:hypothetical protein